MVRSDGEDSLVARKEDVESMLEEQVMEELELLAHMPAGISF